jgi:glycosyltransferase involved in cell wall biosynthesis
MYDLVPLVKSQYSPEGTVKDYRRYITRALKVYDSWLSISENTKVDLLGYAKEHKVVLKSDKVSTIRLGSDIDIDGQTKPLLVNRQTPKDFILSVGTLEPRKNQLLIYQAVKLSIERGIDLPLVIIAGKRGWLSEDLAYMLKNDQTIKGKLLWREEVDDRSLRWLYKNCLFTVYPSNYEGWGLPIAESLAYGKTCISTRTSSIPEIAGDRIRYFSPNSPDELLELLRTYSTNKGLLAKATEEAVSFKQTKWDETYAQVVEHIGY